MEKKKRGVLLELFLSLLKIGLFTFGGGYAMIALLENEFVAKKGWIEKDEFLDMVAIAESTPGPIAINMATYIGYKMGGVLGSMMATTAVCIPSFTIIFVISHFLDEFLSLTLVASAFKGIRVCVVYLIFSAGIKMLKSMDKRPLNIAIVSIVLCCMIAFSIFSVKFSSILFILICGFVGVIAYLIGALHRKEGER